MKHKCSVLALLLLPLLHNVDLRLLSVVDAFSAPTTSTTTTTTTSTRSQRVQRVIESTETEETQAGGAGAGTTYRAFVRAEENWTRLKKRQPSNRGGAAAPVTPVFITDDGSRGSAACWKALRDAAAAAVTDEDDGRPALDYDVVICGGTLGLFFATALLLSAPAREGDVTEMKIGVLEAGKLQGRAQEWNISRKELEELVALGILTDEEVERVIQTEFPGCRSG